jgi:hypothetical protein
MQSHLLYISEGDKKFLVHTSIYQTNKSLDFTAQTRLNFPLKML